MWNDVKDWIYKLFNFKYIEAPTKNQGHSVKGNTKSGNTFSGTGKSRSLIDNSAEIVDKNKGNPNGSIINSANNADNLLNNGFLSQNDVLDWQERMSNTSHQREVADLKAAGINPVLSANNGASAYSAGSNTQDSYKIAQLNAQTSLDIAKIQASSAYKVAQLTSGVNSKNGTLNFISSLINALY